MAAISICTLFWFNCWRPCWHRSFFCSIWFYFYLHCFANEFHKLWFIYKEPIFANFPSFLDCFFVSISINRDNFSPTDILYILFNNLGNAPTSNYFLSGATWTISIEFIFYLSFPFLYKAFSEKPFGRIIGLIFLLIVFKLSSFYLAHNFKYVMYSTLLGRFDQFLFGMMGAFLFLGYRDKINSSLFTLLISFFVVVFFVGILTNFSSYLSSN